MRMVLYQVNKAISYKLSVKYSLRLRWHQKVLQKPGSFAYTNLFEFYNYESAGFCECESDKFFANVNGHADTREIIAVTKFCQKMVVGQTGLS